MLEHHVGIEPFGVALSHGALDTGIDASSGDPGLVSRWLPRRQLEPFSALASASRSLHRIVQAGVSKPAPPSV